MDAIAKTLRLLPDVITLDLEMPNMDGFTFLRWLMKERPTPTLVLSSRSDSRSVFRALELGAVDFLAKPEARISRSIESIREELVAKVQAVLHLEMAKVQSTIDLLAVGKSSSRAAQGRRVPVRTGPDRGRGDRVIHGRAARDSGDFNLAARRISAQPIVISQHMPPGFTKSFAERLNKLSSLVVSGSRSRGPRSARVRS